jgi:caffeoyl-CoA O-methyltransferase
MSSMPPYDRIQEYLQSYVPDRPETFLEMEAYADEHDFPIIGPLAGHFCYLLTRISGARRVFELGSGYGYSTAWFAKAVGENGGGEVHHVVWDQKLSDMARAWLSRLGYGDMIQFHVAEAVETLAGTEGEFDLMFNDINKDSYPDSLPVIYEKLKPGGVLLVDNLLWSGRVMDSHNQETSTRAIRRFAHMIADDSRWSQSTVPLRDGVLVAYKS